MKLSVVIPASNEVESIGPTVETLAATLRREAIEHEILVIDDASDDGTADAVRAIAQRTANIRCERSPEPINVRRCSARWLCSFCCCRSYSRPRRTRMARS